MPVICGSHLHTHTHARMLAIDITTLGQPRSHAPRCGLQPVISTSPPAPLTPSRC